ncbi:hypothetical protein LCGC14_1175330 [marine sediment metagenome]|uniref:Uncharacterized protein n=1 Tax=marine sediment metagenome TaxID=412755 RepID=A0A0F9LTJ2_9ZZZZ
MTFEPQTAVVLTTVPVADVLLFTTPVGTDLGLFAVPDGANFQIELLSIGVISNVLLADGSNVGTVDIEWTDDSNSDTVANLVAAFDLLTATNLIYNQVWRGSQILDPGDRVNAEFTLTTPDTAGEGYAFILEYRVLRHS